MTINALISELLRSKRPVLCFGAGVRQYADQARSLASYLNIPVVTTWGARDIIPNCIGGFGTHGTRAANFTVQNADLLISIGARLDTKSTGDPPAFVRSGKIAMVDIDRAELEKFTALGRSIEYPICQDAGEFIREFESELRAVSINDEGRSWNYSPWKRRCEEWKKTYDHPKVPWSLDPYQLMKDISAFTTKDDILVSDTGLGLGWIMQGFPFKGETFLHALNQTPMGYGLPAACGASVATGSRVILITGDGSFLMSATELATLARWNLNIKIILLDNKGHGMCRQTQRQWLGGAYIATSISGGLGFPEDWEGLAHSFGIPVYLDLGYLIESDGPGFLRIEMPEDASLIPQARYGAPIEDGEPMLPREEFNQQMENA